MVTKIFLKINSNQILPYLNASNPNFPINIFHVPETFLPAAPIMSLIFMTEPSQKEVEQIKSLKILLNHIKDLWNIHSLCAVCTYQFLQFISMFSFSFLLFMRIIPVCTFVWFIFIANWLHSREMFISNLLEGYWNNKRASKRNELHIIKWNGNWAEMGTKKFIEWIWKILRNKKRRKFRDYQQNTRCASLRFAVSLWNAKIAAGSRFTNCQLFYFEKFAHLNSKTTNFFFILWAVESLKKSNFSINCAINLNFSQGDETFSVLNMCLQFLFISSDKILTNWKR